ncbi:MAG: formate-nitrite transporter family protein [Acidobacteriota bacterium]|nr:formate-nitrite transporter family protein [Acidobacteriota bacterium]
MAMPADEEDKAESEERTSPTGAVVYHAILKEGTSELERTTSALAWSGLAAGLSMGFSFIVPALLHAELPDAKWRPLLVALGYPVGFLIVILGRQQLFTENTLTVILPLLRRHDGKTLRNVLRLWTTVLAANTVGALLLALVVARTEVVSHETFESMRELARKVQEHPFSVTLLRGIFAGWLVALTVWLLPFAETARVWVIAILTYVVGVAHFSHIIAGAIDAAFLVFVGESTWGAFLTRFFLPALLGNIIGGVSLVAVLNHAQVVAGSGDGVDT